MKEVSEQGRELLRQALEDAQAELSRKFEIIHEIHTIESLPHIRVRNFDNTEVSEESMDAISHLTYFHIHLVSLDTVMSHVRLQATSCWERCPWSS